MFVVFEFNRRHGKSPSTRLHNHIICPPLHNITRVNHTTRQRWLDLSVEFILAPAMCDALSQVQTPFLALFIIAHCYRWATTRFAFLLHIHSRWYMCGARVHTPVAGIRQSLLPLINPFGPPRRSSSSACVTMASRNSIVI